MKTKWGDRNNMLVGFGDLDSSRPLKWDDLCSPRVHYRPENLRQIVTLWDRLRAAWAVFTMNAVAVAWYDDRNAHLWPQTFFEPLRQSAGDRMVVSSALKAAKV